jgi:hypothetical protein
VIKPAVGDVVHYRSYGTPGGEYAAECRAAIITDVPATLDVEPFDGCPNGTDDVWVVSLAVINPTGLFFNISRHQDHSNGDADGGTWHDRHYLLDRDHDHDHD